MDWVDLKLVFVNYWSTPFCCLRLINSGAGILNDWILLNKEEILNSLPSIFNEWEFIK